MAKKAGENGKPPEKDQDPFVTLNLRRGQLANLLTIINGFGKPDAGFQGDQVEYVALLKQDLSRAIDTFDKRQEKKDKREKEKSAVPGAPGAKARRRKKRRA